MMRSIRMAIAIFLVLVLGGCSTPIDEAEERDRLARDLILLNAEDYKNWGNVDHRLHMAPLFCAPPPPSTHVPRLSVSTDTKTHGKKLYMLFAKRRDEYLRIENAGAASIGQVIVKESWEAEELTDGKSDDLNQVEGLSILEKNGKRYRAVRPADLFVMVKWTSDSPDTDNGWIYGTVSPDRTTVTSAGRVESCMNCHQSAKHDRLFGLKRKTDHVP